MPEAFAGAVIPAPVATVWHVVRDFGGLATWQPAVAGCVLAEAEAPDRVGCVRTLSMADGETVVESLLALDDHRRSLTYGIVSSPYAVQSYRATMRVVPLTATDETFVAWSVDFDCDRSDTDELTETFRTSILTAGLRGLAEHCRRL
ncbi:SRPBCC family protein [Streptomyces sp. WAC 06725]|uniref:SRPBCC family protein n=1 Tax=Streptomyces sp. WAC 06725 TaxID=2203209 RepID=UPI000F749471|nr:SRPBCC family protein [Streptomyces sp. WAC 06725]RSO37042.1 SRPBCC family protein [Streptomyces sp. WAC 06725]